MSMSLVAFAIIAVVLYLLTSAALTVRLAGTLSGRLHMGRGVVLLLGLGAVTLHAWVLYPDLVTEHGLNLGFFNAASLVALLTVTVMLLAAIKQPVENLGIPLLPIAAATLALATWDPSQQRAVTAASWQLDLHILFSVLAYSLLALAAVQAALLSIQDQSSSTAVIFISGAGYRIRTGPFSLED